MAQAEPRQLTGLVNQGLVETLALLDHQETLGLVLVLP